MRYTQPAKVMSHCWEAWVGSCTGYRLIDMDSAFGLSLVASDPRSVVVVHTCNYTRNPLPWHTKMCRKAWSTRGQKQAESPQSSSSMSHNPFIEFFIRTPWPGSVVRLLTHAFEDRRVNVRLRALGQEFFPFPLRLLQMGWFCIVSKDITVPEKIEARIYREEYEYKIYTQ